MSQTAAAHGPGTGSPPSGTVNPPERESLFDRYSLMAAAVITGLSLVLGWTLGRLDLISNDVEVAFYIVAYVSGGTFATIEAIKALIDWSVEIDLLMVTAALGAAIIGHWTEGAILLFLFSLGNALEHYAMGRTKRAVQALMELSPEDAVVVRDGQEQRVHISELQIGDLVLVRPGERIPADGVIASGESAIDQAAITGESMPVVKSHGEDVFTGTINGHGALQVTVTRLAHESTLAKIIKIVQEAQEDKSRTQRFTDRFEGTYAVGVIAASLLYLGALVSIGGMDFNDAFYRSMILLVVASPCALVISTPASTLSALANAARNGILVKGAAQLEDIGTVSAIAFDKTGTLTVGKPRVTDIVPADGIGTAELLTVAASAERMSEHPLADAIVNHARSQGIDLRDSGDLQAITGKGISTTVDGAPVIIGTHALMQDHDVVESPVLAKSASSLAQQAKTAMYVARAGNDGRYQLLGIVAVADTVRPQAASVIRRLHEIGVKRTLILTGDNERSARAIADQLGVDDVRADLLPAEKLEVIEQLKREHGAVVMVGDGVNDAPALARSSIGVAMGAAGSDVALETADVVLMADDLEKLPYVIELSRKTRSIIRQNLTFALGVISVLVIGTVLGVTTLPLGVVGHEGSTIVVVMNGLRLLRGVGTTKTSLPFPNQLGSPVPAGD
ncbi:MAG: heavy metal translocating P-type ATPase [Thermomicrobiales bacterium]